MRLQKNTSLALYSVIELAAEPERQISAAEIAAKYGVSAHHLAKVLSELAHAGIVDSVRGAGGGHRFIGNPRRLTLLDIIERFEEIVPASNHPEVRTPAGTALTLVLAEIDANARATFASITLATMLRLMERRRRRTGPRARD
ncbi:MAG TPA: Rrf2 family transcriptional regulator [Casimicrobiaceae bacterium]